MSDQSSSIIKPILSPLKPPHINEQDHDRWNLLVQPKLLCNVYNMHRILLLCFIHGFKVRSHRASLRDPLIMLILPRAEMIPSTLSQNTFANQSAVSFPMSLSRR